MGLEKLLQKTKSCGPDDGIALIKKAYDFASQAHAGQTRKSGEPFMEHPLGTASILGDLQQDSVCIAAALLHDVPEDCGVPMEVIEKEFGTEVRRIVDGVTKLAKIPWAFSEEQSSHRKRSEDGAAQAENLRKMFLAMAEDIRVVLVKLADRLHNMRTLRALPPAKRRAIAQQTLEIYAPLASRLGIWDLKWELEDLSFLHMDPQKYREIARLLASRRSARESYVAKVIEIIKDALKKEGVEAEVTGRPKHIYSIYKKMDRYALQGKDFQQIYDLFAVRILVNQTQDCYMALGTLHSLWPPIPGQFDDYIASPKESMYRSLHSTVMGLDGRPLEVQIRTYEMHKVAEYGIAAHWRYKEGVKKADQFDVKLAWLRQLMAWQKDVAGAQEFVEGLKTDIFQDQVYVFTPKGEIKDLPRGSTPIDFAYRIHTDLGHKCVGAKVNGRLVSLDGQLRAGDIVEIIASKSAKGPSRDWLNPHLGYVKTSHARQKIRQWFKKQERTENIQRGKEMLEKELRRLGIDLGQQDEIARLFKHDRLDDFLASIGYGEIDTRQIAMRLALEHEPAAVLPEAPAAPASILSSVEVMGVGELLTYLARCCNPLPGDDIVGYITRSRGVAVHRKDCPNAVGVLEKERLIRVGWGGEKHKLYPVAIRIDAWDRVGLLRDVSAVVSAEKSNILTLNVLSNPDTTVSLGITFETTGIEQLSRVLSRLEAISGVFSVVRDVSRSKP